MTYGHLERIFRNELSALYPPSEILAIYRTLVSFYDQLSPVTLHFFAGSKINAPSLEKYYASLDALKKNMPVQYITGEAWFMELKLNVTSDVLIPRPETEELVNLLIEARPGADDRILDLGTGAGCIALAAADFFPHATVWAIDQSEAALEIARQNAALLNLRVNFLKADFLQTLPGEFGEFNWLISNPPYISLSEKPTISENVHRFEPHEALFVPDENPLLYYEALRQRADELLKPGGMIFMECHAERAENVALLFKEPRYRNVDVIKDLSGKQRFVKAEKIS
jgi:release factor glutamine methyltransferase